MNSVAYRVLPIEVAGSATDLREASSGSTSPLYLRKVEDGFSVRQGHLAPPVATPDSPRPQKAAEALPTGSLTVPTTTAAPGNVQLNGGAKPTSK